MILSHYKFIIMFLMCYLIIQWWYPFPFSRTCRQLKDEQMVLSNFEEKTEYEHQEQEKKLVDMNDKVHSLESNISDYESDLNENMRLLQLMTKEHSLQVLISVWPNIGWLTQDRLCPRWWCILFVLLPLVKGWV